MCSLCEAVSSEMAKALLNEELGDYQVAGAGPNSCIVSASQLEIVFTIDPRDKAISSTLAYPDIDERINERLDSHVIGQAFPDLRWRDSVGIADLYRKVALEVENVRDILQAARENDISPRDLIYFQLGYASCYTRSYGD